MTLYKLPALLAATCYLSACFIVIPFMPEHEEENNWAGGYGDPRYYHYGGDSRPLRKHSSHQKTRQLSMLITNLEAARDVTRVHAASDLGALGPRARMAVPALIDVLRRDSSKWVRRAAVKALGAIGDPRAESALEHALRDSDRYVAHSAEGALRTLRRKVNR